MLELVRKRYILRNAILITVILIVLTWIPKSNGQVPQRKDDSKKQEERQSNKSDKNAHVENGRNKNGHTNSKVNEITSELTDTEIKAGDKTNDEEKEKEGKGESEFRLETLVVSAGGNKEIQLPKNELTLSAFAVPADDKGEYKYEWTLVEHPTGDGEQVGHMEDINTANLKLSELVPGLYTFKVAVSAEGKYGETLVNVTVKPPARINKAPEATITPTSQQVNQPNDVVLDGSQSKDDDKIVKYHWELVSGPLIDNSAQEANMDGPMLVLKGLSPGNYKFKLTVTDSDGATNSTFASVTVIKEVDYPPKANAGSNVIISLPQNSVTLYGNSSTDDKGIASYEWIKHEDHLTADMLGVRTQVLRLENLEVGDYTFTLKVTDTAGQTSTADVHVFVKPEHNKPPVSKVGKDVTIFLPRDTVILNGTNSTDDQKISSYKWNQVRYATSTVYVFYGNGKVS